MKNKSLILIIICTILSGCNSKKEVVQLVGEFEDTVQLVPPSTPAKDSDFGRIDVTFKSNDLTYKINIAKRLLTYIPDVNGYYKFNWNRYELKDLETNNNKIKELHCWESVTDSSGKVLIFDGYETFKVGDVNPDCEVTVDISANEAEPFDSITNR